MRNIRWLFSNWQLLVVVPLKIHVRIVKPDVVQIINTYLVRRGREDRVFFNILKCIKLTGGLVDDHSSRV